MPANPHRWGAFAAGAAAAMEVNDQMDRFGAVHQNMLAAHDYLNYAPNDVTHNDRVADLIDDTFKINAMSELGGDAGAFMAGIYSTKQADKFMDRAVKQSLSNSLEGQVKLEAIKRQAASRGIDPNSVGGIGVFKQNIPANERTNPLKRPWSPGKTPLWAQLTNKPLGFVDIMPIILRIPYSYKVLIKVAGIKVFRIVTLSLSIYLYIRYFVYLTKRCYTSIQYYIGQRRLRHYVRKRHKATKRKNYGGLF